jgi:hypothetical protein
MKVELEKKKVELEQKKVMIELARASQQLDEVGTVPEPNMPEEVDLSSSTTIDSSNSSGTRR